MPRMRRQSERTRALNQRVRDNIRAGPINFREMALTFETQMRRIEYDYCGSCKKAVLNNDINHGRCSSCRRSRINLFSAENSMNLGDVPHILSKLTDVEKILIARVQPVISVFRIRGQQTAYHGHVINFIQHTEDIASVLPPRPASLTSVILLSRETPSGLAQFRVRSRCVKDALVWLKTNNPHYFDIRIDQAALDDLPDDGDITTLLPSVASALTEEQDEVLDDLIYVSCYPNIPAIDQANILARDLRMADVEHEANWPAISQNPINEFTSEGLLCKAFPTLFPYGIGDLNYPRIHPIQRHAYFKFLLQYHDGRFANDTRFPYFAYNYLARMDAIQSGNVYVRMNELHGLTAEDLFNLAQDPENPLANSIMYYGKNLRGTRAFWRQRCSDLIQMVRQIGMPTIFFTLSAADYHWPDLFRILRPDLEFSELTETNRRKIMHDNQASVAWFFRYRAELFISSFMVRFFSVTDYWYRYEWQHRGSPHIHGVLWLNNAPPRNDIATMSEADRNNLVRYFDALVKATISDFIRGSINPCTLRFSDISGEILATDLDRLLVAVQRHTRCGTHCLRKKKGSRQYVCRYGFPLELEERSHLLEENGQFKFIPERNDERLQRYNPYVTQLWRGNTDFSAITSKDAVINYIAKYASKGEERSVDYSHLLRAIINRNAANNPAATIVRQLLVSSVAERNYSAQEIMHLVMGWPLYHVSRTIVYLPIREDWQRFGTGETNSKLVRMYAERDESLDEYCLYEFAKQFKVIANRIQSYNKEAIVRIIPSLRLSEDAASNEDYYKFQCKLYINWRGDFNAIKPDDVSWEEFYIANQNVIEDEVGSFISDFPEFPEELEFEPEEEELQFVRDANLAAARLGPGSQVDEALGERIMDEANDWPTLNVLGITTELLTSYLRSYKALPSVDAQPMNQVLNYDQLTEAQRSIIRILSAQLDDPRYPMKRVLIQGKAGTGKSAIIKIMCKIMDERSNRAGSTYKVLAPTGAAAMNIDGKTIHSCLRIPINGSLYELNGEGLRNFQLEFATTKVLIFDEYSMIGLRFFNKIHTRLCQARGNFDMPFGGYNVYFFGDLRQLPPVRDSPIYVDPCDDYSRLGTRLVDSFQKQIVLSESHRQYPDQVRFKDVLDKISRGTVDQRDWEYLIERRLSLFPTLNVKPFTHLFPTNSQVEAYNVSILAGNRQPIARIDAIHNCATARQATENLAGGLSRSLLLSVGCKVILRKNLCVAKGLVNGSNGIVEHICYSEGTRPPMLPELILVRFEKFAGPFFITPEIGQGLFPIQPVKATWRDNNMECERIQFPIMLSYGMTIHKAQGLTMDKVVVDIGKKESAVGLTYVALSRVRTINDLYIGQPFSYNRLSNIRDLRYTALREQFMEEMFE